MKILTLPLMSLAILVSSSVVADTLLLTDSQTITGTLLSVDKNNIQFELGGQKLKFERSKVKSITFEHTVAKTPAIVEVEPVQANGPIVIPANTQMMVKMASTVNSSKHPVGYKFTARLEADIVINNETVIPRRTVIYGVISESKKSSRLLGKSNMSIKFTNMMVNNKLVPIKTSDIKSVSESTTKDTVARTARFAAIGGLANGSDGAANMAKAGLGVSLLTSGSSVNIPSGTLLEFTLASPVTI